jgi:DNA-binding response OmpR family regulator
VIRILWIGLPAYTAPIKSSAWYINDFATDLADAELFTMSRHYDAVVFAKVADAYTMRRRIEQCKAQFPSTLVAGLGLSKQENRERFFFAAGGDEYIPFPHSLDGDVVRLRIERFVLNHFTEVPVRIGAMTVDPAKRAVCVNGETVILKEAAFKVLYRLMLMRTRLISREALLSALYENPEYASESGIDYAVGLIRERIDRRFGIETVRALRKKRYGFVYNSKSEKG